MQSTMQYQAPLDVDLSPEVRANTYRQQRVKDATNWAKRAARLYAKVLIRRQETDFNCKDVIEDAGGEQGIAKSMATYTVFEPLRQYAARVCVRLVRERLIR
jgi:hypothetical protein